jgi:MFS family permease
VETAASTRTPGPLAVVGVSLASLAAGTFCTVGIGALAPELQADLGFSRAEIGLLTALVFAGASAASRKAGTLTDSAGPVVVLAGALLLFAVAFSVVATASAEGVVMGAAFVAGLGYGATNPPTNVVVAGTMTRRLGFFMSLKQTGVPVGGFLAGLVLPPIAVALSWRWAFGFAVLVVLVTAASTALLRGASVLRVSARGDDHTEPSRRERLVIAFYGFVMAGIQWVFLTYFVLYLTDNQGFSLQLAGVALALATAFSVGGRLFWGWLSDHRGRHVDVLLCASAIAVATLALLAAGVGGAAIWPLAAVTGAALVGWNGVFHALLTYRAGPGAVGRLSGEVMALVFAGSVVLPPLIGLASEQTDSWTLLWALAAGCVAAAGIVLRAAVRDP